MSPLRDAIARRDHRRGRPSPASAPPATPCARRRRRRRALALDLELEHLAVEEHPARVTGRRDPGRPRRSRADAHLAGADHAHADRSSPSIDTLPSSMHRDAVLALAAAQDDRAVIRSASPAASSVRPRIDGAWRGAGRRRGAAARDGRGGRDGLARDRSRAAAARRGAASMKPVCRSPARNAGWLEDAQQERDVGADAEDGKRAQRRPAPRDRRVARFGRARSAWRAADRSGPGPSPPSSTPESTRMPGPCGSR